MKTDQTNKAKNECEQDKKKEKREKFPRYIAEKIFSRDGITQIYFLIIVSLLFNMGIGLYYCGKNMKNDYNIVSNIIFEMDKNSNGNNSGYPKRMNILDRESEPDQTLRRIETYGNSSKNETKLEQRKISSLVQPKINLMPTCLYSKKFPDNLGLNELLFWNASSDNYIYWCYKNETDSFLILTFSNQFPDVSLRNTPFSFVNEDQPIIASFQNYLKHENMVEPSSDHKILAFGENSLPPYWYMNWRSSDKKDLFRPSFLPCLGSLYTYRDNDLANFFETKNVIYACNFKVYIESQPEPRSESFKEQKTMNIISDSTYLEIDNVPFVKISEDYYTSFVRGSKNILFRLHINKCIYGTSGEEVWVISYSKGISVSKNKSFCKEKSSWISFSTNPILLSNYSIESGDWKSRIENDKFGPSKGIIKNKTCYDNWWTTYGGVPSKQFVPLS
ncbi:hypothetical protein FG379_003635 [Cryptosporidium bovis]|uniref:uncharacterized protein n=1 Tax=Cryptosporidium bovis TaxID=310047 RepID=UPI00351A82A3|nr:hypothetical protein FG379_003635 [Cryptosporidium bovis]